MSETEKFRVREMYSNIDYNNLSVHFSSNGNFLIYTLETRFQLGRICNFNDLNMTEIYRIGFGT